MTMEEKYPSVYRRLEEWSKENKAEFKRKLDENTLAEFEYLVIMTKLYLSNKEEAEDWLNQEEEVNFNKNHPELREGEMFFSNDDNISFQYCLFDSKRKGEVAYDNDGRNLTRECAKLFPTFISVEEFEWDKTHNLYGEVIQPSNHNHFLKYVGKK